MEEEKAANFSVGRSVGVLRDLQRSSQVVSTLIVARKELGCFKMAVRIEGNEESQIFCRSCVAPRHSRV